MRRRLLALGILGLALTTAAAADLESHAFEFVDGCSRYHFTARLRAPAAAVLQTLVDPARIAQTNDGIRASRVVSRARDGSFVREIRMEQCVVGFCFDIRFVERVHEDGPGALAVTQLPNAGTLRRGEARWTVASLPDGSTRMSMEAEQEPSFWVPPIIGPFLMRRTFEREVRETVGKIETVSNAAPVR